MKKSIGIIAAVLLTGSIYSQNYDPATPHQSSSSTSSQSESSSYSSPSDQSSPGRAEYDAQSSLRAGQESSSSTSDDGSAKQGRTLTDEEAAQVLRNNSESDLANRNQEQGLTDPDRSLNSEDQPRDLIYEEWILITPEDVGSPGESETGTNNSRDTDVPANPEGMGPEEQYFSQFDRETGDLNDERIDNSGNYYSSESESAVGAPGESESGTVRSSDMDDDDCEVEFKGREEGSVRSSGAARDHDEQLNLERESVGAPPQSEWSSENSRPWEGEHPTVQGSGSQIDHDERLRLNRAESGDDYRGSAAEYETEVISEPADTDTNRTTESSSDSSRDSDEPSRSVESETIPPDL
jgi:hypothetical protein